ncbi:MAG: response regulator, partial [Candidatus Zixiibacteriota bacterium]
MVEALTELVSQMDLFNGIQQAYSAEEAWTIYKKTKPIVVLSDLKLPGENGLDLLAKIRQDDLNIPVLIMTGYGYYDSILKAYELGADLFLLKPFEIYELKDAIKNLLSLSPQELKFRRDINVMQALHEKIKILESIIAREKESIRIKDDEIIQSTFGSIAHSLKGEFMHIGNSIREILEAAGNPERIEEECKIAESSIDYSQLLLRRLMEYLNMGRLNISEVLIPDIIKRSKAILLPRIPDN